MGQAPEGRFRRRIRCPQPIVICRTCPSDVVSGGDLAVFRLAGLPAHCLTLAMPVDIRPFVHGLVLLPRTSQTRNSSRRSLTPRRTSASDLIPHLLFDRLCLAGATRASGTGALLSTRTSGSCMAMGTLASAEITRWLSRTHIAAVSKPEQARSSRLHQRK
jgi:hypothetical protein